MNEADIAPYPLGVYNLADKTCLKIANNLKVMGNKMAKRRNQEAAVGPHNKEI